MKFNQATECRGTRIIVTEHPDMIKKTCKDHFYDKPDSVYIVSPTLHSDCYTKFTKLLQMDSTKVYISLCDV